jgi:hypothetical protein
MLEELHCSETVALFGNASLFVVAALAPIILAPLSGNDRPQARETKADDAQSSLVGASSFSSAMSA